MPLGLGRKVSLGVALGLSLDLGVALAFPRQGKGKNNAWQGCVPGSEPGPGRERGPVANKKEGGPSPATPILAGAWTSPRCLMSSDASSTLGKSGHLQTWLYESANVYTNAHVIGI